MTAPDRRLPIHRGPTTDRVGTGAPDASDALDRWLESAVAGSGRRNAALTGQRKSQLNGYASHGGNDTDHDSGAGPDASEPLRDMSPLVATAREFHAYIGDAEHQHGPAVPETEIWERIMNDRLSLPGTSPAPPMPVVPRRVRSVPTSPASYATANSTTRKRSAFMNVLTGTHPAVSLLLAAAVAVAILAVFRSFAETGLAPVAPLVAPLVAPTVVTTDGGQSGSGSEIHLPASGSGSGPAASFLAATPPIVASPAAETVRWLTDADQAECTPGGVPAEPGSPPYVPQSGPLPFSPADPAEQLAAAEVYLQLNACNPLENMSEPRATGANGLLTVDASALESPLLSAEVAFSRGLSVEPIDPQLQRYLSELSAALPNQEWMEYVIEGPQLVASSFTGSFTSKSHRVVLPEDIVRLADGRIGGPMRIYLQTNDPGGAASLFAMRPFVETGFVILTVENGRWVIDELLTICIGDCTRYWQSLGTQETPTAEPTMELPPATSPVTPVTTSEAETPIAAPPTDGTLLIDTGASIVSRPLDGSPETRLQGDDQLDPPTYSRTDVPNVALSTYDKIARNVRTGEVLRTNPYENSIVIGPFWVQYTSQNPAVPVDARIVDLRTIKTKGFFDLADVDPAGLGPEWLIEGTASGTLGVGVVDRATETGPLLAPTMLLIDGDLERTRAVPLWLPDEIDFDGDVLAFSPGGSLVAYLTGTEGNVAIQVETISGEFIRRIPWPGEQPVDRLILTDARTLVIMAEGRVSTVDVRQGANPLAIAAYPDEVWDAVLSPDGSHLLFATLDPLSDPNVALNTAWNMLDIGTGDLTPLPQATGGARIGFGQTNEAASVMLSVPIGPLTNGTYQVLFVDVTNGAVASGQATGVTSGHAPGAPTSDDGAVFAAFGVGSPETPRYQAVHPLGSFPLDGVISVFDTGTSSAVTIPMPEIPATGIEPSLIVSPDGRDVVFSVRWTDAEGEHAQSWFTTTDGASGWTPIDGGLVIQWLDD